MYKIWSRVWFFILYYESEYWASHRVSATPEGLMKELVPTQRLSFITISGPIMFETTSGERFRRYKFYWCTFRILNNSPLWLYGYFHTVWRTIYHNRWSCIVSSVFLDCQLCKYVFHTFLCRFIVQLHRFQNFIDLSYFQLKWASEVFSI